MGERLDAFGQLVTLYGPSVGGIFWDGVKDRHDRESLFQDVWLRAWHKLHTFDITKPFSNWVCGIATNLLYDYFKATKKRRRLPLLDDPADHAAGPPDIADHQEMIQRLKACLKHYKNPRGAQAILLKLERHTYSEIAQALKSSRGTLSSDIFRAKRWIRENCNLTGVVAVPE